MCFKANVHSFGMKVNADKTKIFVQTFPGLETAEITINKGDLPLGIVSDFQYFGSTLSQSGKYKRDIYHCIKSVHWAFGRLS